MVDTVSGRDQHLESDVETVNGKNGKPGVMLRNLERAWILLQVIAVALLLIVMATSIGSILVAPWITGSRCSLTNSTVLEESTLVVELFSLCNVHAVPVGDSTSSFTTCSALDPETIPAVFHGVQVSMMLNMFLIIICSSLATFALFCCKRRHDTVFNAVCFTGSLAVVAQATSLGLYLAIDKQYFFSILMDVNDESNFKGYRFTGFGVALTLTTVSLSLTVVAVVLQVPTAALKRILDARRNYLRHLGLISETSPLMRS